MISGEFFQKLCEAQGKFLVACAGAGAQATTYLREGLLGETSEALATDVACLGPDSAERWAIVIFGTHGSETFSGSAILTQWLLSRTYWCCDMAGAEIDICD